MIAKDYVSKFTDERCLRGLFFLLPFGLATIRHYGSIVFLLMTLVVLIGVGCDPKSIKEHFSKYKYVYLSVIIFFLAASLSFINASDYSGAFKKLKKIAYLLLIIPFVLNFQKEDFSKNFISGIYFSSLVNFGFSIYSVFYLGLSRAQGFYHPIIFGDVMALFGSILLLDSLKIKPGNKFSYLKITAAVLYFLAAVLSGSRGALFSIPFIVFSIFLLSDLPKKLKQYLVAGLIILIFIIFAALKFVPAGKFDFIDRVNLTSVSVDEFVSGENKNSSLGQRFMMWEIAVDVFKNHPLVGTGLGDFKEEIQQRMDDKSTDLTDIWPHAHSIYFNFLSSTGVLGFLALLMVFFSPFLDLKRNFKSVSFRDMDFLFVSIFSFMLFGLTEDWFSRAVLVISFVVCFSLFLSTAFRRGAKLP